jgi:hypothetical protein
MMEEEKREEREEGAVELAEMNQWKCVPLLRECCWRFVGSAQ